MLLNKEDALAVQKYDNFIATSPYGNFIQARAWSDIKSNWDAEYIYLEDESGNIKAALSIRMIEAVPGHVFMYASRGPVCDFYDIETVQALLSEAESLAKEKNAFLLRLDPEVLEDDDLVEQYRALGYHFRSKETSIHNFTQPRYNMILDTQKMEVEETIDLFPTSTRNEIRKSYKRECYTKYFQGEDITPELLDVFFDLIKITSERQGISHRPKDYFERLLNVYPKARMYFVYHEDDVLCGSISIPWDDKVTYLYAGSANIKRNYNATRQSIFEQIEWLRSEGIRYFDFGGVFEISKEDGLYQYKQSYTGPEGLTKFIGELDVIYNDEAYLEFLDH